jgi:dinuclear metal center YbgI/SA1388 family protein
MGCNLKDFSSYLQELLQVDAFKNGDRALNGIQVEGKEKIFSIATAVSASLHVIKKAVELKADLLLVHHGFFWKGSDVTICGTLKEKLKLLLQNEISLLAYHLPLDAHTEFGNNWAVATALGWTNLEPFGTSSYPAIGVKASFPACSRSQFQKTLEKFYGQKAHEAPGGKEVVSSCVIVSGGAHKLIYEAKESGADCFVTGSFDEPIWHAAFEEHINFFAFGHAATEKIGVKSIGKHLEEKFDVKHLFIDEINPF